MSRGFVLAVAAEVVLVLCALAGLGGALGRSSGTAALSGLVLMAALGLPSLGLVLWGRSRSNTAFLGSFGGAMLGKFVLVGAAVLWVWFRTDLPRMEFVWGLLTGWVASFWLMTTVLRRPARMRAPVEP